LCAMLFSFFFQFAEKSKDELLDIKREFAQKDEKTVSATNNKKRRRLNYARPYRLDVFFAYKIVLERMQKLTKTIVAKSMSKTEPKASVKKNLKWYIRKCLKFVLWRLRIVGFRFCLLTI